MNTVVADGTADETAVAPLHLSFVVLPPVDRPPSDGMSERGADCSQSGRISDDTDHDISAMLGAK